MGTNQTLDALGDPTRRAICERLSTGPLPVGRLAAQLPVSRPAVSQHLKVLKAAGLVTDRAVGNRRLYELDPSGLAGLRTWLDRVWSDALLAFKSAAEQPVHELQEETVTTTTDSTFQTSITLHAPIERAFTVFTQGFDSWWPRSHHIGAAEMAEAVLEPRLDGRWFERGTDGNECEWGRVLAWDPPNHCAMSWHLNGEWSYDPDPAKASRVEVRFVAETEHVTRVELAHSGLDKHGAGWEQLHAGISGPGGWVELLQGFAVVAKIS